MAVDKDTILANLIADRVVAKLNSHVIPAEIPGYVKEAVKEVGQYGPGQWAFPYPLAGRQITLYMRPLVDGSLELEFKDWAGMSFWRGTLE